MRELATMIMCCQDPALAAVLRMTAITAGMRLFVYIFIFDFIAAAPEYVFRPAKDLMGSTSEAMSGLTHLVVRVHGLGWKLLIEAFKAGDLDDNTARQCNQRIRQPVSMLSPCHQGPKP